MEKWEKNHLSEQFSKGGTGTKQSGIGTTLVLSLLYFDQCSYFGHNLVITDLI